MKSLNDYSIKLDIFLRSKKTKHLLSRDFLSKYYWRKKLIGEKKSKGEIRLTELLFDPLSMTCSLTKEEKKLFDAWWWDCETYTLGRLCLHLTAWCFQCLLASSTVAWLGAPRDSQEQLPCLPKRRGGFHFQNHLVFLNSLHPSFPWVRKQSTSEPTLSD